MTRSVLADNRLERSILHNFENIEDYNKSRTLPVTYESSKGTSARRYNFGADS